MTDRRLRAAADLAALAYDDAGLLPVVAQHAADGRVLMVAWANREALARSLETGELHFWSRSRRELWRKGGTSGHTLALVTLHADCDGDTVLARVTPAGPACHTGEATCFGRGAAPSAGVSEAEGAGATTSVSTGASAGAGQAPGAGATAEASAATRAPATPGEEARPVRPDVLDEVAAVIRERAATLPESSYTVRLLTDRNLRLKKLGEETAELIVSLAGGEPAARPADEAADLIFHVLVALHAEGVGLDDVRAVLARRRR
jgi:phosphoribosyl-ATP pyrophosphohydrolase/phosphoribosyl-AMP cyclohydrolase